MEVQTTLIPLRITPYSDKNAILSAYSRELGMVSCLLPVGAGREARRRRALLMPLCPVSCLVASTPGRSVLPFRNPVPSPALVSLSADPLKCALALFLADLLGVVLRQSDVDSLLFDYVYASAVRLDGSPQGSLANFHIAFLIGLLGFLGISPDVADYRRGRVFDIRDAVFRDTKPLHGAFLDVNESEYVALLSRMNFSNCHLYKYTRAQRTRVLNGILEYMSLHLSVGLTSLKSLPVLHDLFD